MKNVRLMVLIVMGYYYPKYENDAYQCNNLLTLMLFQNCMTLYFFPMEHHREHFN